MELRNKKVLIMGAGKSGIGSAGLLLQAGARPILFDQKKVPKEAELKEKLADISRLEVVLGELPEELAREVSLVVLSPGVSIENPMVQEYLAKQVPVWGEIELAYVFGKGRVIGITGTNGKTTTTTLVGEIMKAYYDSVYVVGNIGYPYTEVSRETREESVVVAEISSFQLESIHSFCPQVSAILNITPDHLDRHHTMECYAAAKKGIARNQTKEQVCVLNYEDPYTGPFGKECPAQVFYFSSERRLEQGIYLEGEEICLSWQGEIRPLMNIHEMNLVGICNVENVMAAIAISLSMKVPLEIILKTVREFQAVEHRIEFVANKGGVDFYNDSKATNPDAAIQGIKAMSRPTVLIGGGYDKEIPFDAWVEAFGDKVKALVLIGQTKNKIAQCAKDHGVSNIIMADTFEEAFAVCLEQARPGDAVLLSPACASWGMFPNYEERGRQFKELVKKIGV